jgi:arylsulfatase
MDRIYLFVPAQAYVGNYLATFKEFPQRQKAGKFNLDEVMKTLTESNGAK